ncbi:unnamed protein product [Symbiodinium sp. KB8]|nr:unnamed protein product [Symbiodinium sp. KB8]
MLQGLVEVSWLREGDSDASRSSLSRAPCRRLGAPCHAVRKLSKQKSSYITRRHLTELQNAGREKQEEDPANDLTPVSKLWTAIVVMGMTIMTMTMMMTMPMMMMMMTMMMMMVMVMVMVMVMMIADSWIHSLPRTCSKVEDADEDAEVSPAEFTRLAATATTRRFPLIPRVGQVNIAVAERGGSFCDPGKIPVSSKVGWGENQSAATELNTDADVRALQPILLFPGLEPQDWDACREHLAISSEEEEEKQEVLLLVLVWALARQLVPVSMSELVLVLVNTGHLDVRGMIFDGTCAETVFEGAVQRNQVSTPEAETLADALHARKQLTKPVRWRCLETNHLAFAETDAVRFNLCKPRPIPELDDPVAAFSRRLRGFGEEAAPTEAGMALILSGKILEVLSLSGTATFLQPSGRAMLVGHREAPPSRPEAEPEAATEEEPVGFFRTPGTDFLPWCLNFQKELLPEIVELVRDIKLDLPTKLKLQQLELEDINVKLQLQSLELEQAIATRIRRLKATKQKQPEKAGTTLRMFGRLEVAHEEAETPKAATAKPEAIAKAKTLIGLLKRILDDLLCGLCEAKKQKQPEKAKKQKQPEKASGQEAAEIPSPPPPPPLPRLEEAETPKAATAKPKAIAKAKKQKQPEKASGQEAAEIPSPPPLPPLPRLEDVKPAAATAKPKAKPQANEQDAAKVKDFVSKLKQADRDEQILAAVLEVAGGSIDPKTSLNLVMQRLRGTNDATVYTCEQRGTTFEGKVALTGEEGTVEFVAKGATKKQAQVNAARVALQGFEQVLERCRPKVDAVAS